MTAYPVLTGNGKDSRYSWYVAGILTLAYILSVVDRQILLLLVGPIERDLQLTDLDFALLSGGAFGVFYAAFGIPLGWAADRFSRKWIISLAIISWSLMTIACGLSGSFIQFAIARAAVAISESALSPAAHSLLADHFSAHKLPRAMSLYSSALFMGAAIALIVGGGVYGWLNDTAISLPYANQPWRLMFVIFGAAGLILALWTMTMREPVRQPSQSDERAKIEFQSLRIFLCKNKRLGKALLIGPALVAMMSFMDFWYPELFIRTWGWSADASGKANGLSSLICGPLGIFCAGMWASRMVRNGQHNGCLNLARYSALLLGCAAFLMPLMPGPMTMLIMLGLVKFAMGFTPVLIPSAIQIIVPHHMRAQFSALFLFGVGAIGMSCGPLLPALFAELFFSDPKALGYSISLSAAITSAAAWFCLRADFSSAQPA